MPAPEIPRPASDSLTIGRILKSHGNRGEVAAEILTDFPDRFQAGNELWLSDGSASQPRVLEGSWFHKGRVILKFLGCDSITAAEALTGLWIEIPRSERRPLPPGIVYLSDLIGCVVRENGQTVGTVEAIEETGATPLLNVRTAEGELLIPFAAEICQTVDVEKQEIQVRLPEGLQELNRTEPRAEKQKRAGGSRRRRNA